MSLVDLVAYAGTAVLVTAYTLLATGRCFGHGWIYNGAKLIGYGTVVANGIAHGATPMIYLGGIYCCLSVVALVRHWRTVILTN